MGIRKLPPHIVNKIAAGEVIARPGSVVKELLENALDAGAKHIELHLEEGGKKLIRVTDDGGGIPMEELPLAFESHATSKLLTDEDLFRIGTLGFRGEALASIGSVAEVTLTSRTRDALAGARLEVRGAEIDAPRPAASPVGTTIDVRNLFFNTPARRKFLKSDPTELAHCTTIAETLALAHPGAHLRVTHNGRDICDLPAAPDALTRLRQLYDDTLTAAPMEINRAEAGINLHGYVAPLDKAKSNNQMQLVFLNGRAIRDRVIHSAIQAGFEGLVMPGRYPVVFLFLDMDPAEVDVNVHPTKMEVRFRASGVVHQIVRQALRETLSRAAHPTQLQPGGATGFVPAGFFPVENAAPGHMDTAAAMQEFYQRAAGRQREFTPRDWFPPAAPIGTAPAPDAATGGWLRAAPAEPPAGTLAPAVTYQQMFNTYIIEETPQGIRLTDQHALHERILYEEIMTRLKQGTLESQRLLIPEPVNLRTPADAAMLLERADLFRKLGLDIAPFEGKSIIVHAVPKLLRKFSYEELFLQLAAEADSLRQTRPLDDLLDTVVATIACKAAVKAGDKLTQEEIRYLIENQKLAFIRHSCPHGRPTALFLSLNDIEQQFKRK